MGRSFTDGSKRFIISPPSLTGGGGSLKKKWAGRNKYRQEVTPFCLAVEEEALLENLRAQRP